MNYSRYSACGSWYCSKCKNVLAGEFCLATFCGFQLIWAAVHLGWKLFLFSHLDLLMKISDINRNKDLIVEC